MGEGQNIDGCSESFFSSFPSSITSNYHPTSNNLQQSILREPPTTIQLPPRTFLNNLQQQPSNHPFPPPTTILINLQQQPSNNPFPPPTTIQQQFNYLQPSSTTSNNLQLPSLLSRRFQQGRSRRRSRRNR